jgi:hypothetical protein
MWGIVAGVVVAYVAFWASLYAAVWVGRYRRHARAKAHRAQWDEACREADAEYLRSWTDGR